MYQPSVSMRCLDVSQAPAIGCLSIIIFTWRACWPNAVFRSPVSTMVVATMITPGGLGGAAGAAPGTHRRGMPSGATRYVLAVLLI